MPQPAPEDDIGSLSRDEPPATANAEMSFSSRFAPHFTQDGRDDEVTSASKRCSQEVQRYS